jgi:hypothetical protein
MKKIKKYLKNFKMVDQEQKREIQLHSVLLYMRQLWGDLTLVVSAKNYYLFNNNSKQLDKSSRSLLTFITFYRSRL